MIEKLQIKVIVSDKRVIMQGQSSTPISTILAELKRMQYLSINPKIFLDIINTSNYQVLGTSSQLSDIVPDKNKKRTIQIRQRQEACRKKNIQTVKYDITAQQVYSQALMRVLADDYESLIEMGTMKKISPYFQSLLLKIFQKCKPDQVSGSVNQGKQKVDPKYETQIKKLREQFLQKDIQLKQIQTKLAERQKEIDLLKSKSSEEQSLREDVAKSNMELSKFKKMYEQKVELIKKIRQSQISQGKQEKMPLNFSQIIRKQFQSSENHIDSFFPVPKPNQSENRPKSNLISNQNLKDPLFHGSSTLGLDQFEKNLIQFSHSLRNMIESFMGQRIKDVSGFYFLSGLTNEKFIQKIKDKSSFVLLFVAGKEIFGLFSADQFVKNVKPEKGFLFSLTRSKKYLLKKGVALWKFSNIQIKIGKDGLGLSQPVKAEPTHMKITIKADQLKDSFQIQKPQIQAIFGKENGIIISSFQLFTVGFVNQSSQIQRQSQIKVEESK